PADGPRGQRARSRARQRPARLPRSDGDEDAASHPSVTGNDRHDDAGGDPLVISFFFPNPGFQNEKQPAVRIDYNISENHRLTGTYNHFFETRAQDHINGADKRFPGSPNYRQVRTTRPT